MDKQSILDWLYSLHRFGIKPGLERINILSEFLGHPEKQFNCIHITGTNGKGSTASNLASILIEAGYKTGLYTSPHVLEFNERIQINSKMIEDDVLIEYAQVLKPLQEKTGATFFELTTAIAFRYFADMKVDIAIIEAGMGGMNDATNIIAPILSIITPISLEHTQYLGNTIEEIAFDKSQIIKTNSKCLISDKNKRLQNIFFQQTNKVSADIYFTSDLITLRNFEINHDLSNKFEIADYEHQTKSFSTPLIGKFQIENALMAIASARLIGNDFPINDNEIERGLHQVVRNTHLSSRFEKISTNPLILLDSGHNPGAMFEIADSIISFNNVLNAEETDVETGLRPVSTIEKISTINKKGFVFLMALMNDKDADRIFSIISPLIKHLILTQPQTPRASNPQELKDIASNYIPRELIEIVPDVPQALNRLQEINRSSIILGSFYLAEEIKRAMQMNNFKLLE